MVFYFYILLFLMHFCNVFLCFLTLIMLINFFIYNWFILIGIKKYIFLYNILYFLYFLLIYFNVSLYYVFVFNCFILIFCFFSLFFLFNRECFVLNKIYGLVITYLSLLLFLTSFLYLKLFFSLNGMDIIFAIILIYFYKISIYIDKLHISYLLFRYFVEFIVYFLYIFIFYLFFYFLNIDYSDVYLFIFSSFIISIVIFFEKFFYIIFTFFTKKIIYYRIFICDGTLLDRTEPLVSYLPFFVFIFKV